MRRKLVYAPRAREDLVAIRRWLTQPGSGLAARQRLTAIRTAVNRLREHPCLYPVVDHPGVRELPCAGGCRALYEVVPDTGRNETAGDVQVLARVRAGQDLYERCRPDRTEVPSGTHKEILLTGQRDSGKRGDCRHPSTAGVLSRKRADFLCDPVGLRKCAESITQGFSDSLSVFVLSDCAYQKASSSVWAL